jgi:NAD(P)H-hydrate epimerase
MRRIDHPPELPERPIDGHKGLFGRVLIVGGSRDMIGAPMLAAEAALRCGCGLVQVAMPRPVLATALTLCPEAIGLGLTKGQDKGRLDLAARASDVVVVGPGMGQTRDAHDRLRSLIRLSKPLVIDADALNLLALAKRWPARFEAPAILTPHPGEMRRLAPLADLGDVPDDDAGRIHFATLAARQFGQVVVLKGHRTVVAEPPSSIQPIEVPRVYVNATGDSSLSKAGTGDVLAGMIASLWAQGMSRFDAACAAVHLHGRAGEIAGAKLGRRSVLARDVIAAIPESLTARAAACE